MWYNIPKKEKENVTMLNFIIKCLDYFLPKNKKILEGVLEMDNVAIYLDYNSNRKAVSLPFFVFSIFWLCIISIAIGLILNFIHLPMVIKIYVGLIIYLLFISLCMAVYGTDIGAYIKINKAKNITSKCIHQDTVKSLFSKWFMPHFISLLVQMTFYGLMFYMRTDDSNLTACMFLTFFVIAIEFVFLQPIICVYIIITSFTLTLIQTFV